VRRAAYAAIRSAIISTHLEPGRQLSENALAAQLGVSRTPVREALARLREDRLVEVVPQLGSFVSRISVSAVDDAQFIRVALECAAIRLATDRAEPADIASLRALLARQEDAREEDDSGRFFALDDDFHCAISELSGRGITWAIVSRANSHLDRVRRLSLAHPSYLAEMASEHRQVVDAVESGEPEVAEQALRHHLRMVLSDLPAIRLAHPDYFVDD